MEDVWGEVRGLQKSAQELAEIAEGLRSTIEGSELSEGATVLVHGLVSRGDLNSQMGLLGINMTRLEGDGQSLRRTKMSGSRGRISGLSTD